MILVDVVAKLYSVGPIYRRLTQAIRVVECTQALEANPTQT